MTDGDVDKTSLGTNVYKSTKDFIIKSILLLEARGPSRCLPCEKRYF